MRPGGSAIGTVKFPVLVNKSGENFALKSASAFRQRYKSGLKYLIYYPSLHITDAAHQTVVSKVEVERSQALPTVLRPSLLRQLPRIETLR